MGRLVSGSKFSNKIDGLSDLLIFSMTLQNLLFLPNNDLWVP